MSFQGTCKFFNSEKGFGFISADDGDLFVHISNLAGNPPQEGDALTFEKTWDDMKQKYTATEVAGGTGMPSKGGFGKKGDKGFGKKGDKGFGKKGDKGFGKKGDGKGKGYGKSYGREEPY